MGNCHSLSCASLARTEFVHALKELASIGDSEAITVLEQAGFDTKGITRVDISMLQQILQRKSKLYASIKLVEDIGLKDELLLHNNELYSEVSQLIKNIEEERFSLSQSLVDRYNAIVNKFNAIRNVVLAQHTFNENLISSIPGPLGMTIPLSQFIATLGDQEIDGVEDRVVKTFIADLSKYQKRGLEPLYLKLIHRLLSDINEGNIEDIASLLNSFWSARGQLSRIARGLELIGDELVLLTAAPPPIAVPVEENAETRFARLEIVVNRDLSRSTPERRGNIETYTREINLVLKQVIDYALEHDGKISNLKIRKFSHGKRTDDFCDRLSEVEEGIANLQDKIDSRYPRPDHLESGLEIYIKTVLGFAKEFFERLNLAVPAQMPVAFEIDLATITPIGGAAVAEEEVKRRGAEEVENSGVLDTAAAVPEVAAVVEAGDEQEDPGPQPQPQPITVTPAGVSPAPAPAGKPKRKTYFKATSFDGWESEADPFLDAVQEFFVDAGLLSKDEKDPDMTTGEIDAFVRDLLDNFAYYYEVMRQTPILEARFEAIFERLKEAKQADKVIMPYIKEWINEMTRLVFLLEEDSPEGGEITEIGKDFGPVSHQAVDIHIEAADKWRAVYKNHKVEKDSFVVPAYRGRGETAVEIVHSRGAGWFIAGKVQRENITEELEPMLEFLRRARTYAVLIADG
ncbi:MAG: hypothetical protein HQ564_09035, partial [Candidatus Saganbacteria bacterium]|nr:hypothetical protein [Candidatus Saganbacteria bacterium]